MTLKSGDEPEHWEKLEVQALKPMPPADPRRVLLDAVWELVERHGAEKVKKCLAAVETLTAD